MLWDIFCRVIDNHGDLGVCWRLARVLAARGQSARLWVDDASALAWMAPERPAGVTVHAWPDGDAGVMPGDVVIEAFGCEPPAAFVARMAARAPAPRWINLEYLSAEDYVERSHGLASPQFSGPGAGLTKHFFYPGFTPRTGGLLREPGLLDRVAAFDGAAWLAGRGWAPRPGERVVSLFAYANPALPALLGALAERPTLLLACPGPLQARVIDRPGLRCIALPYLAQDDYDRLLWACDLNLVRGEDSFVRAQWAGKPYVWHIYPQHDDAHHTKLEAFMARAGLPEAWRAVWRGWNGLAPLPDGLSGLAEAAAHAPAWRAQLAAQPDLLTQLQGFLGVSS
ncbi:elongation factor P maturation arginine rhamnosyltransferase EarP [Roseateles saccharophilus]|uniref:Protein-arginine rhamnosyltransferase n=1 Tax=Roseateles saccharophilus TaxID=304 RepID=A0A4V6P2H6_ROSSA|nr:elongation factor P maturation arginine rhamnosyltransferase EarP [Roseateles saccharophilus]MDG0834509.1 elongation factor P maturation arginine rhamnosyltransferase EarP [Roseateles saccharophilus]TCU89798.1 putative repeat protein (TIGR03837 family) [Roseateles saccharophilus]